VTKADVLGIQDRAEFTFQELLEPASLGAIRGRGKLKVAVLK